MSARVSLTVSLLFFVSATSSRKSKCTCATWCLYVSFSVFVLSFLFNFFLTYVACCEVRGPQDLKWANYMLVFPVVYGPHACLFIVVCRVSRPIVWDHWSCSVIPVWVLYGWWMNAVTNVREQSAEWWMVEGEQEKCAWLFLCPGMLGGGRFLPEFLTTAFDFPIVIGVY